MLKKYYIKLSLDLQKDGERENLVTGEFLTKDNYGYKYSNTIIEQSVTFNTRKGAEEFIKNFDFIYRIARIKNLLQDFDRVFVIPSVHEINYGYCNQYMVTDVVPYEIVSIVSDKTVKIREMDYEQICKPKKFVPGGFVGHFEDNSNQKYTYKSNPDNKIISARLNRKGFWKSVSGKHLLNEMPKRFYDYNF